LGFRTISFLLGFWEKNDSKNVRKKNEGFLILKILRKIG
jgi:hypothetical protein